MKKSRDIVQEEVLNIVLPLHRAGVGLTMGGGKTLIGLRHMNAHYTEHLRVLVVAPKTSIFTEWEKQAEEHGLSHLKPHVNFTTYLSLPKQDHDYDIVYLDECHSLLFTHKEWLSNYKGKILGLSGTPPRRKGSEKYKMVSEYCPIVYTYDTDEAIEDKILNDYKIVVHTLDLNEAKDIKVEGKGGSVWFTSERVSYNYWSNRIESSRTPKETQIMRVMRMKAMMAFKSKEALARKLLFDATDKILLFANTQEQADSFGIPSYHSNNKNSDQNLEDFKTGEITKLACVLQLNEGVNIPNLREGIIMHAYGNERKSSQRIGRLLRLNPNETSTIHILCYRNTVDEDWVKSALENFDDDKIIWL